LGLDGCIVTILSLPVSLVEQGGELIAQGLGRGVRGVVVTGRLLTEAGSDFQGFAGIGETHQVQIVGIRLFEVTLGGVEDGLGQVVLTVAEGFGSGGGIEELLTLHRVFGLDVLLGGMSSAGLDATAPVEIMGPSLDGAQAATNGPGDGGIAALGAQLEVKAEDFDRTSTRGYSPIIITVTRFRSLPAGRQTQNVIIQGLTFHGFKEPPERDPH
jgi:hypothetical protein